MIQKYNQNSINSSKQVMGADTSRLKNLCKDPRFDWISSFSPGFILKLKEKFENQSEGGFNLTRELLMKELKCTQVQSEMVELILSQLFRSLSILTWMVMERSIPMSSLVL
ncbi:hypothetical protein FGO68_gene13814 [Halteria grandinella]|uniref:Uncharacterized protein n=1 Tax=Halteria grandinella TaxID=5974 RepID=A0A8J8P894_HALGN|nr:hypothetical protein FGO68_gene13814 [Halteria grandinella]